MYLARIRLADRLHHVCTAFLLPLLAHGALTRQDFRSADGLYSLVKRRYPDAFVTGRDLAATSSADSDDELAIWVVLANALPRLWTRWSRPQGIVTTS